MASIWTRISDSLPAYVVRLFEIGATSQAKTPMSLKSVLNAGAQVAPTPPVGYPGISAISPGGLDFAPERSSDALLPLLFSSLLSVRVFSALFPPLGPFGDQFQLISGALGPRKHSNFIERVIKFKLSTIFASDGAWGHENHPKTFQMLVPSTQKGTPEEPRSARDRPRRASRASPSHP